MIAASLFAADSDSIPLRRGPAEKFYKLVNLVLGYWSGWITVGLIGILVVPIAIPSKISPSLDTKGIMSRTQIFKCPQCPQFYSGIFVCIMIKL